MRAFIFAAAFFVCVCGVARGQYYGQSPQSRSYPQQQQQQQNSEALKRYYYQQQLQQQQQQRLQQQQRIQQQQQQQQSAAYQQQLAAFNAARSRQTILGSPASQQYGGYYGQSQANPAAAAQYSQQQYQQYYQQMQPSNQQGYGGYQQQQQQVNPNTPAMPTTAQTSTTVTDNAVGEPNAVKASKPVSSAGMSSLLGKLAIRLASKSVASSSSSNQNAVQPAYNIQAQPTYNMQPQPSYSMQGFTSYGMQTPVQPPPPRPSGPPSEFSGLFDISPQQQQQMSHKFPMQQWFPQQQQQQMQQQFPGYQQFQQQPLGMQQGLQPQQPFQQQMGAQWPQAQQTWQQQQQLLKSPLHNQQWQAQAHGLPQMPHSATSWSNSVAHQQQPSPGSQSQPASHGAANAHQAAPPPEPVTTTTAVPADPWVYDSVPVDANVTTEIPPTTPGGHASSSSLASGHSQPAPSPTQHQPPAQQPQQHSSQSLAATHTPQNSPFQSLATNTQQGSPFQSLSAQTQQSNQFQSFGTQPQQGIFGTYAQQTPQQQQPFGQSSWQSQGQGVFGTQQPAPAAAPAAPAPETTDPFSTKFEINGLKPTIFNPQYQSPSPHTTSGAGTGQGEFSSVFGEQNAFGINPLAPGGKIDFGAKGPNPIQLNQFLAQPNAGKDANALSSNLDAILGSLLGGTGLGSAKPTATTPVPTTKTPTHDAPSILVSDRLDGFVLGPKSEYRSNFFSEIPTNNIAYDNLNPLAAFMGETLPPPLTTTAPPPGRNGDFLEGFIGVNQVIATTKAPTENVAPNIYFYNYLSDTVATTTSAPTRPPSGEAMLNNLGTQDISALVQRLLGVLAVKQATPTQG